jgi:uncharacterized protein (DUF1786 family)
LNRFTPDRGVKAALRKTDLFCDTARRFRFSYAPERAYAMRYLLLDIGAGTLDLLWYHAETQLHYKAVCRSPVLCVAEQAESLDGDILVTGCEMGGGALSRVLREKARRGLVVMSESAAATVNHDSEKVRSTGVRVVQDEEAERLLETGRYGHLVTGDLDPGRLKSILDGLGVPFDFDVVGVCAQDHGAPPPGISHLDFRHSLFRDFLDAEPSPEALLFESGAIPVEFSRLRSIAASARRLPADRVFVMDSGMAAVLGASLDPEAAALSRLLVLDVATSHTVGATLEGGEICGFFEYHTADVNLERLEGLLRELADGGLSHRRILAEGGHGAYVRKAVGFDSLDRIVATGPKRGMVKKSNLGIRPGAPLGDNMMTGTAGLLEAILQREGGSSLTLL